MKDDEVDPADVADVVLKIMQVVLDTIEKDPKTASMLLYTLTESSNELFCQFGSPRTLQILRDRAGNLKVDQRMAKEQMDQANSMVYVLKNEE